MSKKLTDNQMVETLTERRPHIATKELGRFADVACDRRSLAGAVSQRACVYSGARVVLNPIADAAHIVHGPIGCAAYTWDIRGSLSSGPQLYRQSFSTDMKAGEIIFGGEKKLYDAILEVARDYKPAAIFVYSTCTAGVIGDDIRAVCAQAERRIGCRVIPVRSEGFRGNKSDGYKAACEALLNLIGTGNNDKRAPYLINILGEFNVAGDLWETKRYLEKLGVEVVASITGDGRIGDIAGAHAAHLNLVQCSGSLTYLAKKMAVKFGIPFQQVSFFGLDDFSRAILYVANFFGDKGMRQRAAEIVERETHKTQSILAAYRQKLKGKKAAIYMGGPAKTKSLIKAFNQLGMRVVIAGTQSGRADDYRKIASLLDDGAVIIDDANPLELVELIKKSRADIFVGGVKERYLAYKLGVAFSDFNHDRDILFAGYRGMVEFAKEVHDSIFSPVWRWGTGNGSLRDIAHLCRSNLRDCLSF